MCSSSSASLRACRWLDELDEDAIRVDREHESPERTLNGLSVDAEETVTRTRRALEKRVEASDLELKLRRAHILHSPLERHSRRSRGRGPRELGKNDRRTDSGNRHHRLRQTPRRHAVDPTFGVVRGTCCP